MTDAFDRLEEQLRQATREHAAHASDRTRVDRGQRLRRGGLAIAVVALLGGGGAVAVAELAASPDQVQDGRHYAAEAIRRTARLPVCQSSEQALTGPLRLTDAAPLPAAAAAVPGLGSASPADQAKVVARISGRVFAGHPILRSTLHPLNFPDGVTGAAYVQQGDGIVVLRDPAACAQARRREAGRLTASRPEAVERETLLRLAAAHDIQEHSQTLWVQTRTEGLSLSGAGAPLVPGGQPPGGLLAATTPAPKAKSQLSSYIGLADRRTVRITVLAQRQRAGVPSVTARSGAFWSLLLPPRTGHIQLHELAADGRMVRTVRLR